ncbi:Uncharacterized protein TCM_030590 [Theobroma cacao]|uniref:Uncharacterized protein n=1 Tax=Theobroma cacao TaxID=3641 RepID=A0A061F4J1_THECC|nr:Uncharacterized protein TCM_030590 [Theobroma cacao]
MQRRNTWSEICMPASSSSKSRFMFKSKVASRRSYTEWIKKSTKNSGELDADIERILRGTRELQLESNSIQERLQLMFICGEVKKDPVRRRAAH